MSPSPNNAHLVNHIPIFETVLDDPAIKWILVLAICRSEMAITTVVGSLVGCEVENYGHELKIKEGRYRQNLFSSNWNTC